MKAPACVNSKAEKVAGIVVNGEPNRLWIWLGKYGECWCLSRAEVFNIAGWCLWCPCCPLGSPACVLGSQGHLQNLWCPYFLLRPGRRWLKRVRNSPARAAPSPLCCSLSSLGEDGPLTLPRSKARVRKWPCRSTAPSLAVEAGSPAATWQKPIALLTMCSDAPWSHQQPSLIHIY